MAGSQMQPYSTLNVKKEDGVVWITFDNPPVNLLSLEMIQKIDALSHELARDTQSRFAVFQSANPEFFIAHADVDLIRRFPPTDLRPLELNIYVAALERIRALPMASIGKIEGIARGGGSEFLSSLDMRFAAIGPTKLGQPEVALGISSSGSGSQNLPRTLGRARALEVALGCHDFTAEEAERYGYINRALPRDQLSDFVDQLAKRIASFPGAAIAATKRAFDYRDATVTGTGGLLDEQHLFNQTRVTSEAQIRMAKFMELGAQTREGELNLDAIIRTLTDA